MVCKNSNKAIDSNKYRTGGPMEQHFQVVFKKKYNVMDQQMEEMENMMAQFTEIVPNTNVKLIFLKDIHLYQKAIACVQIGLDSQIVPMFSTTPS